MTKTELIQVVDDKLMYIKENYCTCGYAYTSRKITDPSCQVHDVVAELKETLGYLKYLNGLETKRCTCHPHDVIYKGHDENCPRAKK